MSYSLDQLGFPTPKQSSVDQLAYQPHLEDDSQERIFVWQNLFSRLLKNEDVQRALQDLGSNGLEIIPTKSLDKENYHLEFRVTKDGLQFRIFEVEKGAHVPEYRPTDISLSKTSPEESFWNEHTTYGSQKLLPPMSDRDIAAALVSVGVSCPTIEQILKSSR